MHRLRQIKTHIFAATVVQSLREEERSTITVNTAYDDVFAERPYLGVHTLNDRVQAAKNMTLALHRVGLDDELDQFCDRNCKVRRENTIVEGDGLKACRASVDKQHSLDCKDVHQRIP